MNDYSVAFTLPPTQKADEKDSQENQQLTESLTWGQTSYSLAPSSVLIEHLENRRDMVTLPEPSTSKANSTKLAAAAWATPSIRPAAYCWAFMVQSRAGYGQAIKNTAWY